MMTNVEDLPLAPTQEEYDPAIVLETRTAVLESRALMLETRIRELEHIVHALLRNRIDQAEADVWLMLSGKAHAFNPSVSVLHGRGKKIADDLDRWPGKQDWSSRS